MRFTFKYIGGSLLLIATDHFDYRSESPKKTWTAPNRACRFATARYRLHPQRESSASNNLNSRSQKLVRTRNPQIRDQHGSTNKSIKNITTTSQPQDWRQNYSPRLLEIIRNAIETHPPQQPSMAMAQLPHQVAAAGRTGEVTIATHHAVVLALGLI